MARLHIAAALAFVLFALLLCLQLVNTWWDSRISNVYSHSDASLHSATDDGYLLGVGKADITGFVVPRLSNH
jgi:hypothetical protein